MKLKKGGKKTSTFSFFFFHNEHITLTWIVRFRVRLILLSIREENSEDSKESVEQPMDKKEIL